MIKTKDTPNVEVTGLDTLFTKKEEAQIASGDISMNLHPHAVRSADAIA